MSLLEWRRPSDVAGLIASVIVDAVERHSFGAISDFFYDFFSKNRVIVAPSVEHSDSSTTVMLKAIVVGVVAPLFDGLPSSIKRRSRTSRRTSVFQCAGVAEFRTGSATGGVAAAEPRDADDAFSAAFASAKPMRAAFLHVVETDCREFAEDLAGDVEFSHRPTLAQSTECVSG